MRSTKLRTSDMRGFADIPPTRILVDQTYMKPTLRVLFCLLLLQML
jgi:hypothetical protein